MKRHREDHEKISHRLGEKTYMADKGLVSRIYKEFLQLKKETTQFFKWAKDLNRLLIKKDNKTISTFLKRCSTSLVIREIQMTN